MFSRALQAEEAHLPAKAGSHKQPYARGLISSGLAVEAAAPLSGGVVERAALEDLAAASRILVDQGVFDAAGHVSMRHPGHAERFLMSRSLAPALVTADDIIELTLDCDVCDARGRRPFIERFLHGAIYRARPDVMAIAHGHSTSVIPFGLVATPMRATYHNAAFLAAGVPVFDIRDRFGATDIVISSAERGAALAEVLADKSVALLRAHGVVVVGPSLQAAVFRAVFTEVSARVQLQAAVLGGPIAALDEEEGRQADAINLATLGRSWELWKRRVTS
jgi:HCOMODA/2-hydroxy-3-carboxy-muconic semialdehyde decarboxylase